MWPGRARPCGPKPVYRGVMTVPPGRSFSGCSRASASKSEARRWHFRAAPSASSPSWRSTSGRCSGNCAEWIVEAPTVNGGQSALARYGDVYFDEGIAGTKNHALLHGGDGHLITMVDSSNKKISIPTRETDELIKIQFTG